ATTFAAVHEPYSDRPRVRNVARLQESSEGIAIKVETEETSDRLLIGFGSSSSHTSILLRSADGEAFQFKGYGFLRMTGATVIARGQLEAFRIRATSGDREVSLMVNGKKQPAIVRDGFLMFGDIPGEASASS